MVIGKMTVAIPPGETIKELLDDRGISLKEFAYKMNASEKFILKLINGDISIDSDIAKRLEMILGVPESFWINLENIYQEDLIKVRNENEMDSDEEVCVTKI